MSVNINGYGFNPYCRITGVSFKGCTFNRIIMHHADLRRSEFDGTLIKDCNLSHANLTGSSFVGSDLTNSNFQFANLSGTNFSGSLFDGADFRNCDLSKTRLDFAYLANVVIDKTTKLPAFQIPQGVDLVGFKALRNGLIATLQIPATAKRTATLGTKKCRAEFVEVLSVTTLNGQEVLGGGTSPYYPTQYHIGETVKANRYDSDIRKECSAGISFYMSKDEAVRLAVMMA